MLLPVLLDVDLVDGILVRWHGRRVNVVHATW